MFRPNPNHPTPPVSIEGWLRRALVCGLALAAGCQPVGTGGKAEVPVPPGGTLRILIERPESLDPVRVDEVYEAAVVHQIYEGLVTLGVDLGVRAGLASSWTISQGGLVYSFQLRPNARFHDGSLVTAEDVVFSLARCLDPKQGVCCYAASQLLAIEGATAFRAGQAPNVAGLRAVTDRTVEIKTERPEANLLYALATDAAAIVPAAHLRDRGRGILDAHPIGAGPFRFVRRERDGSVVLARFDGYWGGHPALDTLVFRTHSHGDSLSEVEWILTKRVDLAALSLRSAATAAEAGLKTLRVPELSTSFLALRLDQPPLDIPEVRQALLHAIDRARLQQVDPSGVIPAEGILPPGMPDREPGLLLPLPDREEASGLLAAAGFPGGRGLPPIRIASAASGPTREMFAMIQRDLSGVGIRAELAPMEWRALDSLAAHGRLQAFFMTWIADLPDAGSYLRGLFHSDGEGNLFAFSDPVVDRLCKQLPGIPAGPERKRLLRQLQGRIVEGAPVVPLYHSSVVYAWRPDLSGIEIGPFGLSLIDMTRVRVGARTTDLAAEQRP